MAKDMENIPVRRPNKQENKVNNGKATTKKGNDSK